MPLSAEMAEKAKKYIEKMEPHIEAVSAFQKKYNLPRSVEPHLAAWMLGMGEVEEFRAFEIEYDLPKLVPAEEVEKAIEKCTLEKREIWMKAEPENGIPENVLFMTDWKLTVAQVAECLGVSENTVFRLARAHPMMKWDTWNEGTEVEEKGAYSYKNSLLAYRRHIHALCGVTGVELMRCVEP